MKHFDTEPGRCKACRIVLKKEYRKKRMNRRKKYNGGKASANDGGERADETDKDGVQTN